MGKKVTPRTINREVGTLSNMLSRGVEWLRIGSNPLTQVKPLKHDQLCKERRSLTEAEVRAIFDHSPAYLRPVFRFLASTGMRRNEVVSLLFSDIDFEANELTIRKKNTKTGKARSVPLDTECMETLKALRERAPERQPAPRLGANFSREHVFVTEANTPLKNNLLRAFYSVCKRAGIKDAKAGGAIDLHALRVTFATLALENGANPKSVQSILGHATIKMTMEVYAKATDKGNRAAIGCLPFMSRIPECDTPNKADS